MESVPDTLSGYNLDRPGLERVRQLTGSGVSDADAELGIDSRFLDILVAQRVFGKVDVFTGVEDVGADCCVIRLTAHDRSALPIPFAAVSRPPTLLT